MKWIFFNYSTILEFEQPVKSHQFVLRCLPQTSDRQRIVSAEVKIKPDVPYIVQNDGFGNALQIGCVPFDHTSFHYITEGEAFVKSDNKDKSALNPVFRYPSNLTKPSPELVKELERIPLSGDVLADARRIAEWVNQGIRYVKDSTDVNTTAAEAFETGAGVCQDYTHVFLTLARLAGIPARYANGLLVGEGATHAWAEVYENGCWHGLDPTHGRPADENYLRFCVGRDYADCPIERGVFFGDSGQRQVVKIKVHEASEIEHSTVQQQQQS
jgi:transglutaminase-like putative cysteine protease